MLTILGVYNMKKIILGGLLALVMGNVFAAPQAKSATTFKPMFDKQTWQLDNPQQVKTIATYEPMGSYHVQISVDYDGYHETNSIYIKNCDLEGKIVEVQPGSVAVCRLTTDKPITFSTQKGNSYGHFQIQ